MVRQANYLGIVVDDIEAATTFYRERLGLEVDEAASIPGAYTQFRLGGDTILALQADTELPGAPPFEVALLVDDADATHAAWAASGVEVVEAPNDKPFGRTFAVRTPDGHLLRAYAPQAG